MIKTRNSPKSVKNGSLDWANQMGDDDDGDMGELSWEEGEEERW